MSGNRKPIPEWALNPTRHDLDLLLSAWEAALAEDVEYKTRIINHWRMLVELDRVGSQVVRRRDRPHLRLVTEGYVIPDDELRSIEILDALVPDDMPNTILANLMSLVRLRNAWMGDQENWNDSGQRVFDMLNLACDLLGSAEAVSRGLDLNDS